MGAGRRVAGEALAWSVGAPALFVVLWSSGFVFAKEALKHAEPMTIMSIRMGAAALLAAGLAAALRSSRPRRGELGHLVVAGLLVHGCYIAGVFAAIHHGLPAGLAALVVGLQPLLAACVVGAVLGDRVAPLQWAGAALGLAGVVLVLQAKLMLDGATAGAVLLALLALVGITAGTLYQKRFCAHVDVLAGQTVQYAAAGLAVFVLALAFESRAVEWTVGLGLSLAWMVLVLSIGTVSLLYLLIRRGAAIKTASLFYLVPPVTALMAWAWFGETLGAVALVGMAVAVAGVALVQRGGREPESAPLPE